MDFGLQYIEGQKSLVSEKHRRKTVLFFRPYFWPRSQAAAGRSAGKTAPGLVSSPLIPNSVL
jgi:hypothetical protein